MRAINRRPGYRNAMARQQSERQKPRHIQIASIQRDGVEARKAIRGGKARRFLLPGSRRDPRWDWLLCPISRIARGRAHRLTAQGWKSEHGNLDCLPGWKPGSLRPARYGQHQGRSFRSSRSVGKPRTWPKESRKTIGLLRRRVICGHGSSDRQSLGTRHSKASSISGVRLIPTTSGATCGLVDRLRVLRPCLEIVSPPIKEDARQGSMG